MYTRRLVKAGQTSHTISLPIAWIEKFGLKRGDIVYLNEEGNDDLMISPKLKEEHQEAKSIEISASNKALEKLQREITSAYMNNYSTISIVGKEVEGLSKDIRRMVQDFVALEIIEQTATRIVAKDLLNPKEISAEKTLRRMDLIVRSMFSDTLQIIDGKDLFESIHYRDVDGNRLYFLMSRIIKGALSNTRFAKAYGVQSHEALAAWYLAVNIKNIADNLGNSCKLLKSNAVNGSLKEIYKKIEHDYLEVMKAYHNKDKDLANAVASNRKNIVGEVIDFSRKNPDALEIAANLKELETFICNIARIVIDN